MPLCGTRICVYVHVCAHVSVCVCKYSVWAYVYAYGVQILLVNAEQLLLALPLNP